MRSLLCRISNEEHRTLLGRPRKWQLLDFMGVAYGTYFIWESWTRRKPNLTNIMIATTMLYIHSERFFYAPQRKRDIV